MWGLVCGLATGLALAVLDMTGGLLFIADNTMYFRTILTIIVTALVTAVISLMIHEPDTYVPVISEPVKGPWYENPRILAPLLLLSAVGMYIFLSIVL